MRRRRRFTQLIERQLEMFAEDQAELLERIAEAREAHRASARDEAEDRFGEYQAWVADATDVLVEVRDSYASTLEDDAADEYEAAFNRAVRRRFGDLAFELEDDEM